ncbi:MAG: rRNA maturation RNase YbeY [Nitrospirota bacterium]
MRILIKNRQNQRRFNKTKINRTARKILFLLKQPASDLYDKSELSILFVGNKEMHKLNADFRGINKTTDVLSFPQVEFRVRHLKSGDKKMGRCEDKQILTSQPLNFVSSKFQSSSLLLGDIVINVQKAAARAKITGMTFYEEIYRLLVHGILHLLGYEHEKSSSMATAMRKKEKELLNAIKKMD